MWVKEASKSEGRAVGHVTCTELVADWAFSFLKGDQLAFLLSKSRSNRAYPANVLRPLYLLILIRERKPQPEPHSFCVRM